MSAKTQGSNLCKVFHEEEDHNEIVATENIRFGVERYCIEQESAAAEVSPLRESRLI